MRRFLVVLVLLTVSLGMLSARMLHGKVVGTDNTPIADALVLVQLDGNDPLLALHSDANGSFTFDLAKKLHMDGHVYAIAPGYAASHAYISQDAETVVTLSPECRITGTVTDAKGTPLAGVTVGLIGQRDANFHFNFPNKAWRQRFTVQSATDGTWSFSGIRCDSTVRVAILDDRYVHVRQEGTVENGHLTGTLHLIARPCLASVSGRVLAPDGTPVPNATVVSLEGGHAARATTDATGAFTLPHQPEGELHLVAATATGGGFATSTGNATDAVITCTPDLVAKPQDIDLAVHLLDADAQLPAEARLFNRSDAIRGIANIDFPRAWTLATANGAQPSDGLRAYLLGRMAVADPELADKIGAEQLDMIWDETCRLYAAIELGIALRQRDPIVSEHCYEVAKCLYDNMKFGYTPRIDGLGFVENVPARFISLAGVLNKTDDVKAALSKLNELIKQDENGAYSTVWSVITAAGRVSPEFVLSVYDSLDVKDKSAMLDPALAMLATCDPVAAERLLQMITARFPEGISLELAGPLLVRELAKRDPAAASRVVGELPSACQDAARFALASVLPKEQAMTVLRDIFTPKHDVTMSLIAQASVIDPEFARTLYTEHRTELEDKTFTVPDVLRDDTTETIGCLQYACWLRRINPLEARLIMETEYAWANSGDQGRDNLRYFWNFMCPFDINSAIHALNESGTGISDAATRSRVRAFYARYIMDFILTSDTVRAAMN